MRQDQYDARMTNRHPSWNRLMGFSPLLEAGCACGAGAVRVVMELFSTLKKGYRLLKRNDLGVIRRSRAACGRCR
jgi:hypothetical protein